MTLHPPASPLRLAEGTGFESQWQQSDAGEMYRRVFYNDSDAAEGQVLHASASVIQLPGAEAWRYSVGISIRSSNEGDEDAVVHSLGYGDVGTETEALATAERIAMSFLGTPVVPPAPVPVPIPNLNLVAPTGQALLEAIKSRQRVVQAFCERLGDVAFLRGLDTEFRSVLSGLADDMAYLIDAVDNAQCWGWEISQELDRLTAAVAAGDAPDSANHTHNDLYDQRMVYHAHFAQRFFAEGAPVVKSWRHHTGEECYGGGWFIVVMQLATGQVSQHYPAGAWELFHVPAQELAPVWDGHTPAEGTRRLRDALALLPPSASMHQSRCDNPQAHDPHRYSASHVFWCPSGPAVPPDPRDLHINSTIVHKKPS